MSATRPTIHDVASKAGVSKSLVSLALKGSMKVSEESREKIIKAAADLGYRRNAAAASLAISKSRTLGVLILDMHNPVFAEILDGVQKEVRQQGFSVMLVSGGEDAKLEQSDIDTLLEFQIEGLILISHRLSVTALKKIATEVPTVTVTREDITVPRLDTVCNDDLAGVGLAVEHLVELGHSRIVHLSGGDNPVAHSRVHGYLSAMERCRLSSQARVVVGGLTEFAGYSAALQALDFSPTALVVVNDIAAIGAIAALEERGLAVPTDISVIGYDGISMGALRSINLTTIAQPLAELGSMAAQSLLRRINEPQCQELHERVVSRLVVRGTTAPMVRH